MNQPTTAIEMDSDASFSQELRSYWNQLPDKMFFFSLLAAWLLLFQFLGNSTFGYVDTPSLYAWMANAYAVQGTSEGDDAHGKLIPLVVLGLMWWKRKELLAQPLRTWWPGLLIVAVALALHLVGYLVQQSRVSIVALFLGIYGLMGLTWGLGWLRTSFFPWFLFVFSVPMTVLTERITFPLQLLVSKLVAFICQNVLGLDVISDGTRLFKMPMQYQYEVAAACSGIRSLIAVTAIAIIYGFMVFPNWWKRVVLIACALPLAVIGNTFRMLAIVLAAEMRGQEAGMAVHDSAFWSLLPYVPAIFGLLLIGRWLEGRPATAAQPIPQTTNR